MKRKLVRLTEQDLHNMISEVAKHVQPLRRYFKNGNLETHTLGTDFALDADTLKDYDEAIKFRDKISKKEGGFSQMLHPQYTDKEDKHNASINARRYAEFGSVYDPRKETIIDVPYKRERVVGGSVFGPADRRPLHRKGSLNRELESVVRESLQKTLNEYDYMDDNDIKNQFGGMKVLNFKIEPLRYSDGWKGMFELEFPNADGIDYNETMVNNFISYDKQGNRIAWDNWMPDEQTRELENMVRNEIQKHQQKNNPEISNSISIKKKYKTKSGYHIGVEINLSANDNEPNMLEGDFEYWVEEDQDDTYISGMLKVENGRVVDYDGCYSLPKAVIMALNKNGIQMEE